MKPKFSARLYCKQLAYSTTMATWQLFQKDGFKLVKINILDITQRSKILKTSKVPKVVEPVETYRIDEEVLEFVLHIHKR